MSEENPTIHQVAADEDLPCDLATWRRRAIEAESKLRTYDTVDHSKCRHCDQLQSAFNEWVDKSEWASKGATAKELGLHLADVIKMRHDQLQADLTARDEEVDSLRKDLESHKRMLLAAACDIGAIGEALGADMDDDGSEIEGLAKELRKDAERYRWLRSRDLETIRQGGVFAGMTPDNLVLNEETLDQAIDAAMAKEADS